MRQERLSEVNGKSERPGAYVLYWMQAAVRARDNFALDFAAEAADRAGLPLLAVFCLARGYPQASPVHFRFLIGGLREAERGLADKGVRLLIADEEPGKAVAALAENAVLVVADCGYSRIQRRWLAEVAERSSCRVVRVEGDVAVPLAAASDKEEWSAYTLRRRIMPILDGFLEAADERVPKKSSLSLSFGAGHRMDLAGLEKAPPGSPAARSAETRITEKPGQDAAMAAFDAFLDKRLADYCQGRNDPCRDATSNMSAALHFGHVSPVALVRRALKASGERSAAACAAPSLAAYIEELIVRRELAFNFVARRNDYDSYASLPDWARTTLAAAAADRREAIYSFGQFEAASTHDPYWNAAQDQMVLTGRMHGYMRMYWGKCILAWSAGPEEAYATAVALNDSYSLDGRDPNGWAGVAWCFGKHDRPWTGRAVFGTVRYMNANGLKRKFDADAYADAIRALKEDPCSITSNTPRSTERTSGTTSKSTRSRPAASAKEPSLF